MLSTKPDVRLVNGTTLKDTKTTIDEEPKKADDQHRFGDVVASRA